MYTKFLNHMGVHMADRNKKMSNIPIGFVGKLCLRTKDMTLAETIQIAVESFNGLFPNQAETCYVLQSDLDRAIDDDQENGALARVCEQIQVMPIKTGLPGFHVMAGRMME